VTAEIRVAWYQLYVLDRQIEITQTNQQLLESLLNVANARIATGAASQGDVLLGTLELSQLEQRLLSFRKQRRATEIEINRLVGQPTDTSLGGPSEIPLLPPELDPAQIFETAKENQPALEAIRLRMQASQWGIEVARLTRRPEMTLSASYFPTDDNRLPSSQVHVGQDPWAVGIQVTLPWSREKYDAIANEAAYRHQTVHSTLADLENQYEALIQSLLIEARRAADTAELHQSSILPQARQTLEADQSSYANGTVEFDRVMQDYRNLLTLELGYHQALGDLAQALARIQMAAGQDLPIDATTAIPISP
jgi:outer membrane protein TolC